VSVEEPRGAAAKPDREVGAAQLLSEGLRRLGIDCPPARLQALERYRLELERWNRRYGFVKASGRDLVVRHFLDALAGLPLIARQPARRTVLDVGSGAGFPGLPLAVFLEDSQVALLERSRRKAAFLSNVVALLGLANVRVLERELRGLEERFELITFRAWSPLGRGLGRGLQGPARTDRRGTEGSGPGLLGGEGVAAGGAFPGRGAPPGAASSGGLCRLKIPKNCR
jgi:16S rRNA (guanine527-N7)-methyltransferase